jgi:hypothetical protein
MSKLLWIKKLGIPAGVAGVAVGALAWQVTESQEAAYKSAMAKPLVIPQSKVDLAACCLPGATVPETAKKEALTLQTAEAPASLEVCPMGYTSEGMAEVKPTTVAATPEYCPMGFGPQPTSTQAATPAPAAPVAEKPEAAPAKDENAAVTPKPRYRLLATLAQADDPLAPKTEGPASLSISADAAPAADNEVDSLIDNISLPDYKGTSKTFNRVAPQVEAKKTAEAAAKAEEASDLVPNPLFPELAKPLVTVEDYKARLAVVEEVGRTVAATAERVNDTAGQWKELYDQTKEQNLQLVKLVEDLKAKNIKLLKEKGELMEGQKGKTPDPKAKAQAAATERVKNLNQPLLNVTEKDLGLPARPDLKDTNRVTSLNAPPSVTHTPPPNAVPTGRPVRGPDGTVYEATLPPPPQRQAPVSAPANVPVAKVTQPRKPVQAPALSNLPSAFPGNQPSSGVAVPQQRQYNQSPEELAAYRRWQRENAAGNGNAAPAAAAPKPAGQATTTTGADGRPWDWDPVTGTIRRTQPSQ